MGPIKLGDNCEDKNIDVGVKYTLPYTNKVLVANNGFVDKDKTWKIWKRHDNTFNIYLGDSLTGDKPATLNKVDENKKEIIVECSDMA